MSRVRSYGFTVIETMLFLAISGALVVGILVGTSAAINVQRYKDATNSFLSYIQSQYDRVSNVQNDRAETDGYSCSSGGTAINQGVEPVVRGTSDCTIIGRLVSVDSSGKQLTSQVVYASADGSLQKTDIMALQQSHMFTSSVAELPETYAPEWDTKIVKARSSTVEQWRLLIVRSPSTGTIRTFVDTTSNPVSSMVSDAGRVDLTACVDSQGLITFGRQGITILKDAANSTAVKLAEASC